MLSVRERPPLRLGIDIKTPNGTHARWAPDEHSPNNVLSNLSFSSTIPGGFEQMGCTLPRKPSLDYPDLAEFSTITVYGARGIAWQGRLQTAPRASGDQVAITPGAVGWQAHLDDDGSARMIYVDSDLTKWQPSSVQQKLNDLTAGIDTTDPTVTPDQSTGAPSLASTWTGPTSRAVAAKGWYDAKSVPIGSIYWAWKAGSNVDLANPAFDWSAHLSSNDIQGSVDSSANLRTAGATGSLTATAANRLFAWVQFYANAAYGTAGDFSIFWQLAIVGNHGLPLYTGNGAWSAAPCVLASDVIAHAVGKWAPKLATTQAGLSTIQPTTFRIPNLVFTDPTTAGTIVKAALAFELLDWWVDEGPTFRLASRTNHGRHWRARVGPSGLQETGPQVDLMINKVMVAYNDVTGITRTVGPTGSGADTIDDSLADSDPANPINVAGLVRYPTAVPNIGTGTPAAAIAYGARLLAEEKQASTSGQANIVGHVQDDHGVWFPAWAIRAGDWISFTDAHSTDYRRVVRASYTDSSRTCQLDLDSPPEDLDAVLARLTAAVGTVGFK